MRHPHLLALASALVLSSACTGAGAGAEPEAKGPTDTFSAEPDSDRIVTIVDQSGDESRRVSIPAGKRSLVFRMDCFAPKGRITVSVDGAGGDSPCTTAAKDRVGTVILGDETGRTPRARTGTFRVKAPQGARWSVALDVR